MGKEEDRYQLVFGGEHIRLVPPEALPALQGAVAEVDPAQIAAVIPDWAPFYCLGCCAERSGLMPDTAYRKPT